MVLSEKASDWPFSVDQNAGASVVWISAEEAFFDDRFSIDLPSEGTQLPGIIYMMILSKDRLRLLDDRTGMS